MKLSAMNVVVPATEFEICVSMTDLVVWSEDENSPVSQHPNLKALFDALAANIDLLPIAIQYFKNSLGGFKPEVQHPWIQ